MSAQTPVDGKLRAKQSGDCSEFDLIKRYFEPLAASGSFSLGDDAAVLTPKQGRQLVFTADAIVSGVHFLADDPPGDVAAKLLGVNLSDLAAMGAEGLGYLVTTAWPSNIDELWISSFAKGLAECQARYSVGLLGGDTVATNGPMCLSLTAIGDVPVNKVLRRNGANVGDLVYVSGCIGDAGVGLRILRDNAVGGELNDRAKAIEKYRCPQPRLGLGQALRGLASACIDVSDGVIADLEHLANESRKRMIINLPQIPVSPLANMIGGAEGAIIAGDDYELLFTSPPVNQDKLQATAKKTMIPITCIGEVLVGEGIEVLDNSGNPIDLTVGGFKHF